MKTPGEEMGLNEKQADVGQKSDLEEDRASLTYYGRIAPAIATSLILFFRWKQVVFGSLFLIALALVASGVIYK